MPRCTVNTRLPELLKEARADEEKANYEEAHNSSKRQWEALKVLRRPEPGTTQAYPSFRRPATRCGDPSGPRVLALIGDRYRNADHIRMSPDHILRGTWIGHRSYNEVLSVVADSASPIQGRHLSHVGWLEKIGLIPTCFEPHSIDAAPPNWLSVAGCAGRCD